MGHNAAAGEAAPTPADSSSTFRLASWNILADAYCSRRTYPYCTQRALDPTHRHKLIREHLLAANADVLCLQEVEDNDGQWSDFLSQHQYISVYSSRQSPHSSHYTPTPTSRHAKTDGCLIAYSDSVFTALDRHHTVRYNDLADACREQNATIAARYYRHNIGQFVLLEHMHTNKLLLVVNTHLYYNPLYPDLKLRQMAYLLTRVESYIQQMQLNKQQLAVVVAGDLNSNPRSSVYQLCTTGHYNLDGDDDDTPAIERVKLLVDVDMNKVCRWARAIGVDTEWWGRHVQKSSASGKQSESGVRNSGTSDYDFSDLSEKSMFDYARRTNRILVTRSRQLIERSQCPTYFFVDTMNGELAFEHIVKHFDIKFDKSKFYSRCTVCNAGFEKLDREQLLANSPNDLPAGIVERNGHDFDGQLLDFWRCKNRDCYQLYWWSGKSTTQRDRFEAWLSDKCVHNDDDERGGNVDDGTTDADKAATAKSRRAASTSHKYAYIRSKFEKLSVNSDEAVTAAKHARRVHTSAVNGNGDSVTAESSDSDSDDDAVKAESTVQQCSDHRIAADVAQRSLHVGFSHQLQLHSAYADAADSKSDPPYTNCTDNFADTLDYILYSVDALAVVSVEPLPSDAECRRQTALPSDQLPSDHLMLCATLDFR